MRKNDENEKYSIIVGCGRLGASIANKLSDSGQSVLVIDKINDAFKRLSFTYGGLTYNGDATDFHVLDDANAAKATSAIVVTDRDNTNILIAQIFKERYNVPNVIVRLYESDRACVYDDLDIKTICPVTLSIIAINDMLNNK